MQKVVFYEKIWDYDFEKQRNIFFSIEDQINDFLSKNNCIIEKFIPLDENKVYVIYNFLEKGKSNIEWTADDILPFEWK